MNYAEIGRRIRACRKQRRLSQEQLAEKVNISPTHMSHIETGSTKLSLNVLVELAESLGVGTDDLIFGERPQAAEKKISEILAGCSHAQMEFIASVVETAKDALDKYQRAL